MITFILFLSHATVRFYMPVELGFVGCFQHFMHICHARHYSTMRNVHYWKKRMLCAVICEIQLNKCHDPYNNKKAQLMLAYPRDAKTMKKIPPFRSYNKFQSSRKSGVYSN